VHEGNVYLTDPLIQDTDGDGLFDGTEVDMAAGAGCPSPNNADSDGDTLSDGAEVDAGLGTNPCDADTDGDTDGDMVDDKLDDLRALCDFLKALPLEDFDAPNNNARKGRRNAMCNKLNSAAKRVSSGDYESAEDKLESLLQKLDDDTPPDWMVHVGPPTTNKDVAREDLELMIFLIGLEL